jgi:hypothetical protein
MKKIRLFFMFSGLLTCMMLNSCKKTGQSSIQALFTGGTWQLASVMAFNYVGNTQISTDTLNNTCQFPQYFTFQTNNTCTYTNFDCIPQAPSAASWSLSPNQLYLDAEVVCKDSTATRTSKPFSNAKIVNLGRFSLILQTGDFQPNYSLTKKRRIVQYGFIRKTS